MRSQSSVLAHSTKSLNSLISNKTPHHSRATTPAAYHSTLPACSKFTQQSATQSVQMTTGGGVSGNNTNPVQAPQKSLSSSSFPSSCNTITSTSSNTLSKASTISSTIRHSNGSLSTTNNNNNSSTTINNNKTANKNNNGSGSNTSNNETNNNQNPNWSKLQTLEQRKLELEKLLNEKNWLLQQIYKQEAQVLNGNYENFNLFETNKDGGNFISTSATTTNSIQRRKGSSSLKLSKSNVHVNGKNNRITLSKSEYDLVQENKHNNQQTTAGQNVVISMKKRSGPPQKTNSFHDSTSASALSLTKSPSLEYNGNTSQSGGGVVSAANGSIKYNIVRPHHGSSENLTKSLGVTQCDKYYLSPTSQMYSDGSGFIKASQNIKQCRSPSTLHKVIALNDTEAHRSAKQQQLPSANGQNLVHHNGSHPYLDQYESVDALSLSPSTNYDQGQHAVNQHSNLWRTLSNNDRSAWCDSTSYVELDSDGGNQYHNLKPLSKKVLATAALGSSVQQSPESSPSMGNFYSVGSMVVGSYPNIIEKACDEVSISSVNSETSKKPKNKQWMESSLDGPIMRPNILQQSALVADTISLCPSRSPTLSQNPQYSYYRQPTSSSSTIANGKITPSPAAIACGSSLLVVPGVGVRPPARTLAHHSHPHHKHSYRERTKLSSQSMSSGSYRAPKAKIDDDNNHLSHSTSYLNVDPYLHHHFHLQSAPQPQPYHHNHYHVDIPNSSTITMQQQQQPQQKPSKPPTPSTSQQLPLSKFSPTMSSSTNGDEFVGTIRYATSVVAQPSRLCNPSQAITKASLNNMQTPNPPNTLSIGLGQQLSPKSAAVAATSPDIRIESPKNMTVVQQATFLPYKEVTKPFEMSDFYKYSTKYRQKEANTSTMSKNAPQTG